MRGWLASNGITLAVALIAAVGTSVFAFARPVPPPIEVRPLEPSVPTAAPLYVHVDGAVVLPGVYALPTGARVFEAMDAAGGATEEAELRELNLAARVTDGQKLVVPARRSESERASPDLVRQLAAPTANPATNSATAKININTATQRVLESLPGIGPVTAARVVEYRQSNGPFTRIEQLREARLVNQTVYQRIQNLIAVE